MTGEGGAGSGRRTGAGGEGDAGAGVVQVKTDDGAIEAPAVGMSDCKGSGAARVQTAATATAEELGGAKEALAAAGGQARGKVQGVLSRWAPGLLRQRARGDMARAWGGWRWQISRQNLAAREAELMSLSFAAADHADALARVLAARRVRALLRAVYEALRRFSVESAMNRALCQLQHELQAGRLREQVLQDRETAAAAAAQGARERSSAIAHRRRLLRWVWRGWRVFGGLACVVKHARLLQRVWEGMWARRGCEASLIGWARVAQQAGLRRAVGGQVLWGVRLECELQVVAGRMRQWRCWASRRACFARVRGVLARWWRTRTLAAAFQRFRGKGCRESL